MVLERTSVADTELEPATARFAGRVVNRDAVVKAERADGQVQADAQAPVVGIFAEIKMIRLGIDHPDIVEEREAHAFDDGDAVLSRAEPHAVAAQWFIESVLRSHVAIAVAAQRFQT